MQHQYLFVYCLWLLSAVTAELRGCDSHCLATKPKILLSGALKEKFADLWYKPSSGTPTVYCGENRVSASWWQRGGSGSRWE